jgi:competence protein ComEC
VLGMRGETPEEVRDLFEHTGTLHLFAVSGLNVAMLAYLSAMFLRPLRIRRDILAALIIPIIGGYAILTGLSASCIRAAIMGGIMLAALLCDRPAVLYNTLGAAALGILAYDTNQLFTPGFQFSFVLVFTLIWLNARVQKRLEPLGEPDDFIPVPLRNRWQRAQAFVWRHFAAACAVTITAWLGSLLFTAGYFHLFSPSALLANLAAVPIAFTILGLGLLATLTGWALPGLAAIFNNANWACCKMLLAAVEFCAGLPGGYSYVQLAPEREVPVCEVMVLDLDDGAAIHVRTDEGDWLIDCGHVQPFKRTVLPYLRSRGIDEIAGIILTHGDAQHIGGATSALKELRPASWWDGSLKDRSQTRRKLHQELAERGIGKRFLRRSEYVTLGLDCRLDVLFPPAGYTRSVADDKALVLRLTVGDSRVLFMSDAGFATETWLIENEPDLRADVLVKGWHSKDVSGGIDFITRVAPKVVIAAAPNFGTRPERIQQWAESLRNRGTRVLLQEEVGGVRLDLTPDDLRVAPYLVR